MAYSSLRYLRFSSESQNTLRPDVAQQPGKTDNKEFSVPWHLMAVTFGFLCLLLSVTIIVLLTKIFHLSQEKHQQQEFLGNLTQKYHFVRNDNYLKKRLLENKTLEYDTLKYETFLMKNALESLILKKNGCYAKEDTVPKSLYNPGKLYEDYWSCYGVHCYYFVLQDKSWTGCKQTCQSYGSSLLKIDNEHELAFVQFHIHKNTCWIGLSFNDVEWKWKWLGAGTSPGMNFTVMNLPSGRGRCAFLTSTGYQLSIALKPTAASVKRKSIVISNSMCT
uniref:C-type lectin domain-containing protein n=1 Tax=Oryctolagus cuniculus TaxID=9986 RepID=G1SSR9_RABIT